MALLEEFQRLLDKIDTLERKVKKLEAQRERHEYVTYEGIFTFIIGHKMNEKGEMVGLHRNTLKKWKDECGLEVTKVGNLNLYKTESLLNMLKGKSMYRAYLKPD